MDEFICARCRRTLPRSAFHEQPGRAKPVTSRCRECRSEMFNSGKYPACPRCGFHRRQDQNQVCFKCNVASGLRECRACRRLLPALLSFYPGKGKCKECLKAGAARTSPDVQTSSATPSEPVPGAE